MQHQLALLLGRLNPYKTHGRASHRLTDCLRVGGIVLIALDVGLHILRRHQADLVAQLRQLTRPIVRRGTGLHADDARRQSFEERHNLAAAKLLSDDDLLGPVNAVNLEHVLGDIQTDRGNLHVDGSLDVIRLRRTTLWHFDAGERAPSTTSKSSGTVVVKSPKMIDRACALRKRARSISSPAENISNSLPSSPKKFAIGRCSPKKPSTC